MRTSILTALAITCILLSGLLDSRADAMTLTASLTLNTAGAQPAIVQQVVNLCTSNGCAPVQTKRVRHYKAGGLTGQHI
jgi:hypothetical protein